MPDYIINKVTLIDSNGSSPEKLEFIMNTIKGDDICIDFQKIIPIPKIVLDTDGMSFYESDTHPVKHVNKWCIEHWGTKWNALKHEEANTEIKFYDYMSGPQVHFEFATAWETPEKIFKEMAWMFGVHIEVVYHMEFDKENTESKFFNKRK